MGTAKIFFPASLSWFRGTKTSVFYYINSETVLQMHFQLFFLLCWKNDISWLFRTIPWKNIAKYRTLLYKACHSSEMMFVGLNMVIISYFGGLYPSPVWVWCTSNYQNENQRITHSFRLLPSWSYSLPYTRGLVWSSSSLCLLCIFCDSLGVHLLTVLIFRFLFVIMWWAVNVSRWAAEGNIKPTTLSAILLHQECFYFFIISFFFQEFVIWTVSEQHSQRNLALIWRPAEKQASFHFVFC